MKGAHLKNCNCAFGCPCQFNALPTYGDCRAAVGYQIDQGHHGDVSLDGIRAAALYAWPARGSRRGCASTASTRSR